MMAEDELNTSSGAHVTESIAMFHHLRELATDALRYWEVRRVVYNIVLASIFLGHFIAAWPASRLTVTFDSTLALFLLAVLANLAFSAVYVADVFIQFSGFRESRSSWRWLLLLVGFAFAAIITHFVSSGMFATRHGG